MAKELPYFKFEPGQWENGKIQMMPKDIKGLFIDLCSIYWSRLGDLPYKLAVQKLCDGNANALQTLCDENIIALRADKIYIKFLSEQLNDFKNKSEKASKSAGLRWSKSTENQKVNANALRTQCESNANKEKIREDKSINTKLNSLSIEERKLKFAHTLEKFKDVYERSLLNDFYKYWTEPNKSNSKFRQELEKTWNLERRLETWAKNDKNFKSKNQNGGTQQQAASKRLVQFSFDSAIEAISGQAE